MNRSDVIVAKKIAVEFARACDELLATKHRRWDGKQYVDVDWSGTGSIAGKATGAHRRLSLDLTRALAHMRRRT